MANEQIGVLVGKELERQRERAAVVAGLRAKSAEARDMLIALTLQSAADWVEAGGHLKWDGQGVTIPAQPSGLAQAVAGDAACPPGGAAVDMGRLP